MSEKNKYVDMCLSYKNIVNVNEVGKEGTLHLCLTFLFFFWKIITIYVECLLGSKRSLCEINQ